MSDDPIAWNPTAGDLGRCPFCNGRIAGDGPSGSMFHSLPTCTRFDRMDPLEFVTAVREHLEKNGRGGRA